MSFSDALEKIHQHLINIQYDKGDINDVSIGGCDFIDDY